MINWPEMLRDMEHWADGFLTGAAAVSLIAIAGAAILVVSRALKLGVERLKRPMIAVDRGAGEALGQRIGDLERAPGRGTWPDGSSLSCRST